MKFSRYAVGGNVCIGMVDAEKQQLLELAPRIEDMQDLIDRYPALKSSGFKTGAAAHFDEVRFVAPFGRTRRNIFCVGKNYREHAREFSASGYEAGAGKGAGVDEFPAVFTKPGTCIVGPGAAVSLHADVTNAVDYEVELALVIGRAGRNIRRADAYSHIFGYCIVNDVTARDRQRDHKQWFLGKALDGFCPMGPWIATADEVDAEQLDIRCWVNGELRQSANTRDLIFNIPTLIETISAGLTLLPGDIIATGTPAGVGIGFNPPRFLKPGDTVSMSITGLGSLSNPFI